MPYDIIKKDNKYELRLVKGDKLLGTHDTKKEAQNQIKAIEIDQVRKTGRLNPELWEKSKKMALDKFDNKHSARMIQYAGKIYRNLGGKYTKDLKPNQKSLVKWTDENWGRDILLNDIEGRYLPKKIREQLNPIDYLKTSIKKTIDRQKGLQYSSQPINIVNKINKIKLIGSGININDIIKSEKPNKKLKVKVGEKWVHFGDKRYGQYKDKTGIYKDLDHLDEIRRYNYLRRSMGIRDKKGNLTMNNPNSPNYWSIKILW